MLTLSIAYSTLTLSPVLVFGCFIGATRAKNADFDASRLFTSLILISLLSSPLIRILQIIPSFGAAKACFERLHVFLQKPERLENREISTMYKRNRKDTVPLVKVLPHSGNDSENPDDLMVFKDLAVLIQNAELGWGAESHLRNVNLEVLEGEHIAITGSVGCGKSLLLQAILGEADLSAGIVRVGTSRIGYCGQNPWLENITAWETAFRCVSADEAWRQSVIEACALEEVLSMLTSDETIGTGGARISGGERQRLVSGHIYELSSLNFASGKDINHENK